MNRKDSVKHSNIIETSLLYVTTTASYKQWQIEHSRNEVQKTLIHYAFKFSFYTNFNLNQ